jgi:molecular chaperone GrpE (heat shock protein)
MADQPSQEERARQAMEEAEKRTASAMEKLVQSNAFGELLARSTENVMGLTRIGFDTFDLVIRNLRIAGRKDVARLGTQLARTEDKLERVLQEVEGLRDELKRDRSSKSGTSRSRASSSNGSRSSSSRSTNGRKRSSSRSKSS